MAFSSKTTKLFLIALISSFGFISACSENNFNQSQGSSLINTHIFELSFSQQPRDSCVMQKNEGECIALTESTTAYIDKLNVPNYIQLVHRVQL